MRTESETYTAPDYRGEVHTWRRDAGRRYGRTVIGTFPRPGRDPLTVAWPEVPRLSEALRVRMVREALRLLEHPAAETATDAELLAEGHRRLIPYAWLEVATYAVDGAEGVDYTTPSGGGSRWADAFAFGEAHR